MHSVVRGGGHESACRGQWGGGHSRGPSGAKMPAIGRESARRGPWGARKCIPWSVGGTKVPAVVRGGIKAPAAPHLPPIECIHARGKNTEERYLWAQMVAAKGSVPDEWIDDLPVKVLLPRLRRIVRRWESRAFTADRDTARTDRWAKGRKKAGERIHNDPLRMCRVGVFRVPLCIHSPGCAAAGSDSGSDSSDSEGSVAASVTSTDDSDD